MPPRKSDIKGWEHYEFYVLDTLETVVDEMKILHDEAVQRRATEKMRTAITSATVGMISSVLTAVVIWYVKTKLLHMP